MYDSNSYWSGLVPAETLTAHTHLHDNDIPPLDPQLEQRQVISLKSLCRSAAILYWQLTRN